MSKAGGTTYASFSYYQNDLTKDITFGNRLVGNYTYDTLSRVSSIILPNGQQRPLYLTYSYNKTGTVSSVAGQLDSAPVNEQYNYDPLGRMTNASLTVGTTKTPVWYEYDSSGNRLRQSSNNILTTYNYNPGLAR